jgi:hypothetical protein
VSSIFFLFVVVAHAPDFAAIVASKMGVDVGDGGVARVVDDFVVAVAIVFCRAQKQR